MTFMELIRRKGAWFLAIFLGIFVISLAYGLTVGGFSSAIRNARNSRQGAQQDTASGSPLLLNDGDWKDTALKVNGRKVSTKQFDEAYQMIMSSSRMPGNPADIALDAYGYTAQYLSEQELILAKAEEMKIEVTAEDLDKARAEAAAAYMGGEGEKKGNVVSDVFSGLEKRKQEKAAFATFLQATGRSQEQWENEARRNLLIENTRTKIQEEADAELKKQMEGKKAEVDAKLKEGKKFADLAKEYSDDDRKAEGGEMGWIGAGLLQKDADYYEAQRKALFETPVGQISEWVDIPAGFVRYEIYDRKKAEGPDFEKEKPNLIDQIKKEHPDDADYTPTEEEIKERYDQVAARQIMLRTSAPDKFGEEINKLKEEASYEFNNLYVLANQALNEPKLQPPADASPEQLEDLAKKAAVGTGYDFQLIKDKRQAGEPQSKPGLIKPEDKDKDAAAEDKATETPAGDEAAATETPAADAAAEDSTAESADTEADAAAKVDIPQNDIADKAAADKPAGSNPPAQVYNLAETPIYALAIGLLETAAQNEGATATALPHYLVAKTYSDWLEDEEMLKLQPIEREKAREAIEKELASVVEKDNYNADAFAMRGLNLAWMDKKDEAYKQLEQAIKYARQEEGPTWEMIQKAYEVFDDQSKMDMVADKLAEFRQKKLQEMIQQAQAQQENSTPVMPDGTPVPPDSGAAAPPTGSAPPADSGAAGGAGTETPGGN